MVAYSFQRQFIKPILAGAKRQTIRGDRKRHARVGEQMQLYTAMRTKYCRAIGVASCLDLARVLINFEEEVVILDGHLTFSAAEWLEEFARNDGFDDWNAMRSFWRLTHQDWWEFNGVLIRWTDFKPTPESPNA